MIFMDKYIQRKSWKKRAENSAPKDAARGAGSAQSHARAKTKMNNRKSPQGDVFFLYLLVSIRGV